MSGKKKDNFSNYLRDAKNKAQEFSLERNQLDIIIKNHILSFQIIDSEIHKSLIDLREFYIEKRNNYNNQLKKLKIKRIEYEKRWNGLKKKFKTIPEPEINANVSVSIDYTRRSLEDIQYKIDYMSQKLDEEILDIDEENEIIENLKILESERQNKIQILTNLEQKQIIKFQSSEYNKTSKEIDIVEENLREIYENMGILSYERLMTHKKILDFYRKIKEFEDVKKKIEIELIDNKKKAAGYHQVFLKLMDQNKKVLLNELINKTRKKLRPKEILTPKVKAIIRQKKKYKNLEKKKLVAALNKQRLGKRLDFYEMQLILKHTKKKKD
ncbi:MAG: hypothetical protein ACFFE4_10605 [Candidatus Thorarchaeota archaeon]